MRAGEAALPGIVIPAYQPDERLEALVARLLEGDYPFIVVVNDGSSTAHAPVFERLRQLPRVELVTHFINLGKGEALKTGFNHALVHHPDLRGLVTVDADGQHRPEDVARVAECLADHPDALCMGVRRFSGDVPWRSRVGNTASRIVLRMITGGRLHDTQTGLRGIPRKFLEELLPLHSSRYEFELEMLMRAYESELPIRQVEIETVYTDGNAGSHFNPVWDSLRVYFVFFRFLIASILTASLDLVVFAISWNLGASLFFSQALARAVAGGFNFLFNKHIVFKARDSYLVEVSKYLTLVVALMLVSYFLIDGLVQRFHTPVLLTKIGVETFLFLASFTAQRLLVFRSEPDEPQRETDWDRYYRAPALTAGATRKITGRRLIDSLRLYGGDLKQARLLEIGGGSSCFFDTITEQLEPAIYEIVDNNPTGLALFREQRRDDPRVRVLDADVRRMPRRDVRADVCFSVGLIEHFDPADTARAVEAHFDATRPGGLVVIFFPTPTWLYRVSRAILEAAGAWDFPDERPLEFSEVMPLVESRGEVLARSTNWWIILTQGIVVARVADRRPDGDSAETG
ncbi:MAG: glycosyltransferase [Myxococcota bacterium]